jgi:DNA-binding protein
MSTYSDQIATVLQISVLVKYLRGRFDIYSATIDTDVNNMAETPTTPSEVKKPEMPRDVILVGKKPVMSYAMAALMQLNESGSITIKARGNAISSAVDVAEVVSKRFMTGSTVQKEVTIGTEVLGDPPRNVSTIEIKLTIKK